MVSPDYIDRQGIAHWKENSIPETSDKVMQFTGQLDKDGKEIYEEDYVVMSVWNGGDGYEEPNRTDEFEGVVRRAVSGWSIFTKYNDGEFEPEIDLCENDIYIKIEILGNSYEDTELLNE